MLHFRRCFPLIVVMASLGFGEPVSNLPPAPPPPKEPEERLAPRELSAEAAKGASAAMEAFEEEVGKYREAHRPGQPDKDALAVLKKHYQEQRATVAGTESDALLTYSYVALLRHHQMHQEAKGVYEEAVKRFEGTAEAARLRTNLADLLLDEMNDPAAALKVLAAIGEPPAAPTDERKIDPWMISRRAYEKARVDAIRCTLRQGKVAEAEARFKALEQENPRLRKDFTWECDFFDAELKKVKEKGAAGKG